MGGLIQPERPHKGRAGDYVPQPGGYSAFIPEPLPPSPPLRLSPALVARLSGADLALGRLDGAALTLPDPDLFVGMYVRQEAVLSSQIEGTQASLTDLLQLELWEEGGPPDVREVVNYVDAMNHGLERLTELPLSLRLVREIHAHLMAGVRGGDREPGEFRKALPARRPAPRPTFRRHPRRCRTRCRAWSGSGMSESCRPWSEQDWRMRSSRRSIHSEMETVGSAVFSSRSCCAARACSGARCSTCPTT